MIVGREAERAALGAVLDAARRGDGASLLLRGEPGAGKSVLLDEAVAAAQGMRVVRVRGVESESPLPFAAVHRLVRPLLRGVGALPVPQAAALRHALGMSEAAVPTSGTPAATDRFLVYLAILTLLSEAAATDPTLVLVDDLHWVDVASREALLFVARRTEGERLAVVLAARDDQELAVDDIPDLRVRPLELAAARTLLSGSAGGEVPDAVARRLHTETGGNALALAELGRALGVEVLTGQLPLPRELPVTDAVEAAFLDRYRRLDQDARTVVLVVAAEDSGELATVQAAARLLGADEAIERAERSGLLVRAAGRLEPRHPLVRSAVYTGATTTERRRVHAALAEVLTGLDPDRRAWHLAAAADLPDEQVVGELEASAGRAAAMGGHEAASAAWERAAELTADAVQRGRRLHQAAAEAWTAGQPDRAASLADAALLSLDDPLLRADTSLLRARVEWNTGSVDVAHHRLLQEAAAVHRHDPARARELAMFAASLEAMSTVEPSADLLAFIGEPVSPRDRCVAEVLSAFVSLSRHRLDQASVAVRAAERYADEADLGLDPVLANLAVASLHLALDDVAVRLHERLLTRAREAGALIMVLYALTRRGAVDVMTGRWDELAAGGGREALGLARATGRRELAAMPLAWLAVVAALRGDDDSLTRLGELEEVVASGTAGTTGSWVRDQVSWARALLADSPVEAVHHYEQMTHGFAERLVGLDRIEAAVAAARTDLAQRWLDQMERFSEQTGSPWGWAVVEHGRALLAGEVAEDHFVRAVELHQGTSRRYDAARTRLAYGEWLRRERRRVDARPHLRAALQTFEDLRARRWADRAAQELRATGERTRRRTGDEAGTPTLTATELGVARLVAQGLPTREVAARLFVSPRTVDFHLRNVYAKLGLTSRAELAHVQLG